MMGKPIRLLLVEDTPDDAELVVHNLRKGGFELMFERVDTPEAMESALTRENWDIIIADYSMPKFSGLEALKLMQSKHLDLPFILVSGTVGEDIAVTAMIEGAHDYVLKDKLTRLAPAVFRELREATSRRERKKSDEERVALLRDLQESVRVRDEFLSIASHELKTPLTPLQLHIDFLLRNLLQDPSKVSSERMVSDLKVAKNQIHRLTLLIETLLDISRITAGRLDLQYEDMDLTHLIQSVADRMRPEIDRARCHLIVWAESPVKGKWDRMRLDQVVTNLLSNAIKYGPGKPIEVNAVSNSGKVHFSVRDHGIGIKPEDQGRIFGRFERAVPNEHYSGFGLGLWIVNQIINAHGGAIRVKSSPGEGAIFEVELPKERHVM